jgi:hypothetical protein
LFVSTEPQNYGFENVLRLRKVQHLKNFVSSTLIVRDFLTVKHQEKGESRAWGEKISRDITFLGGANTVIFHSSYSENAKPFGARP